MRIGITAEFLGVKACGPATYTRNLLVGLAQVGGPHQFIPYLASERGRALLPRAATIAPRVVRPYSAWVRLPFSLPAELLRRPIDLLHAQGWAPPWSPCPTVVTIHDLSWETTPAAYTRALRWRLSALVRLSARRARRVITSSRHSASDLTRLYGLPPEKIRVVHPALDPVTARVATPAEVARVRADHAIAGPYILYLGVIEPKKNVDKLINAYAALRRERGIAHQLVIAGRAGWLSAPILELAASLGLEGEIRLLGEVPLADVAPLYTGADVVAFLSSAEGFGYPPLEAMACGTPVLSADTSSLPEVVGDAALLVDPLRLEQVAHGLARLLDDAPLRATLRARGLRRAAAFQPAPLARRVVEVYEECLRPAASDAASARPRAGAAGRPAPPPDEENR